MKRNKALPINSSRSGTPMLSAMRNQQQHGEAPGVGRGKFFGRLIDKVKPKGGGGGANNGNVTGTSSSGHTIPVASKRKVTTDSSSGLPSTTGTTPLINDRTVGWGNNNINVAATAAANLNTNPANDYNLSQLRPAGTAVAPNSRVPVPNPTMGLYAPSSNDQSRTSAADAGRQQPYRPPTANNKSWDHAVAAPSHHPNHESNYYALNHEDPLAQPNTARYLPPAELPTQTNHRNEFSHELLPCHHTAAAQQAPPTPQYDRTEGPPRSIDVILRRQQLVTSHSSWGSIISDISSDDFLNDGYSLRNSLRMEGRCKSFCANNPEINMPPRRVRSSSSDDLETLQQLLEVFPNASPDRAKDLLKHSSIRTAMNVLAEESFNDEDDFRISGSAPLALPVVHEDCDSGVVHELQPEMSEMPSSPQLRHHDVQHVVGPPPDQQPSFRDRKLAADPNRLPPAQHIDGPPLDRASSFDDRKPAAISRRPSSIRRRNSFTSLSEFEGDAPGLNTIMEVFPAADESRSNYLLRQHSISTVLMILASESVHS